MEFLWSVFGPVLLTFHMLPLQNILILLRNWSSDHIITTDGVSLAFSWSVRNVWVTFDQALSSVSHIKLTCYQGGLFFHQCDTAKLSTVILALNDVQMLLPRDESLPLWECNATATAAILTKLMPRVTTKLPRKMGLINWTNRQQNFLGWQSHWIESIKRVTHNDNLTVLVLTKNGKHLIIFCLMRLIYKIILWSEVC